MKNIVVILMIVAAWPGANFCHGQSNTAVISGTIINGKDSLVKLRSYPDSLNCNIQIFEGKFHDTVKVVSGIYEMSVGREFATLYLEPGFNLSIQIDMNQFDESITYNGKGMLENSFLAKNYLAEEAFKQKLMSGELISEGTYLARVNEFYSIEKEKLNQLKGVSGNFKVMANHFIDINKINTHQTYLYRIRSVKGPEFKVSDSLNNDLRNLDVNNPALLGINMYSFLIQTRIRMIASEIVMQNQGSDFNVVFTRVLDSLVKHPDVKNRVIAGAFEILIGYSKDKEEVYTALHRMATANNLKSKLETHYKKWEQISKGKPSPDFKFNDINGIPYSLADLRGNIVYIDVWATWCQPCLAEIPELKKLEAEMNENEILFVSICMNDKKEKWEAMVKEKDLKGIQLFATDHKADFFIKYAITGIPRFILIDREGNIIDANAKRPSDPELRKTLESLL